MQLEHEKFEAVKELATISTKIAEGEAILAKLKEDKEAFLEEREKETVNRIKNALESSVELIKEVEKNHDALVGYRREVEGFVEDLRSLVKDVEEFKHFYKDVTEKTQEDFDRKCQTLDEKINEARRTSAILDGERYSLQAERKALGEERKKLRDERETLTKAWKELEAKKIP